MRRDEGFTLLEVLVALAIAVPALLVLYRQGAAALEATGASLAYQEAIARAESRLASLTEGSLQPGDREGDDGGSYHWHTRVVPAQSFPLPRALTPKGPYAAGVTLYDIAVQISWPSGPGTRSVNLQTRRLGPAASETP